MEIRQLRITAKSDEDAIRQILDRWPEYEPRIKRSPVPYLNGLNWYEFTLVPKEVSKNAKKVMCDYG